MRAYNRRQLRMAIISYILIAAMLLGQIPQLVYAAGEPEEEELVYEESYIAEGKEKALHWLMEAADEDREWEDHGLPNLTCNAMAVLREEGQEAESVFLKNWEQGHTERNVDEQAHLAWAWKDRTYLNKIQDWQNEDGGFGITKEYCSDIYDTLLVLMAESAVGMPDASSEATIDVQAAVQYILGQQRKDGGFGYTVTDVTAPELSAEIGLVLVSLDIDNQEAYEKLDTYCEDAFQADFSEENFNKQAKLAEYLYRRNRMKDPDAVEEGLFAIWQADGSIYGSVGDTIRFIRLLNAIQDYRSVRLQVQDLSTEADRYVLEADKTQQVELKTTMQYTVNRELSCMIRYTVLEDDAAICTETEACILDPDLNEAGVEGAIELMPDAEKNYILMTELVSVKDDEERVWASSQISFSVHKTEVQDLVLQAETSQNEGYGVKLSWNDISDGDNRYGYRVFRRKEEGNWETRSTWDGEEKVKVLNIYPTRASAKYLKEWMEKPVCDSEEPAGKNLFQIDTVYIDDYNREPDTYLKEENGEYKYDVLVFGICNGNGWRDLSELSYEATRRYIDSGRGVLFGHDTVIHDAYSVKFARFAEDLGIIIKERYTYWLRTKVKVVNTGFLTSYPWKLSGTLTVPSTHISGQYTGGSLPATVWMEMDTPYETDEATGAKTNAYLFTNNQLAMCQTGNSDGQATDDERKVIANTIFYLKQLTNHTTASDKSFYDEAAPEVTEVSEMGEEGTVTLQAQDKGTKYQYRVEAVHSGDKTEDAVTSNVVDAEAISGIKGFVVGCSTDEETMEGLPAYDADGKLISEVIPAENGSCDYKVDALLPGESRYLHIYAVDYAGNISEECVRRVTRPEHTTEDRNYFDNPYALFGTEGVSVNCSQAIINGDIYGGGNLQMQGSVLTVNGAASTSGMLSVAGGSVEISDRKEGVEQLAMPDYTEQIIEDMKQSGETIDQLQVYNSTEITTPTICQRSTGVWCDTVQMAANLFSMETVSLNANTVHCGGTGPMVLCSQNGDIYIQTTKFDGNGLLYAPNGTVTIHTSEFNYKGTIIAKKIQIQGTILHQN